MKVNLVIRFALLPSFLPHNLQCPDHQENERKAGTDTITITIHSLINSGNSSLADASSP